MLVGTQSLRGECSLELFANDGGDLRRAEMAQKHELAIANGARDAHEHIVVLGQILKQRLPAQKTGALARRPSSSRVTGTGSVSTGS
ncbi:MAG TPA: hypothetical protein VKP52_08800 [Pseudolabrys sp.]|nr:hypothetical protein [Pseudolabrys sp.]